MTFLLYNSDLSIEILIRIIQSVIRKFLILRTLDYTVVLNMPMEKAETIDEYISLFPADVQNILEKLRKIISKSAPDAEEAISYGMPTFKLNGNLVHFAAHKNHVGFYPTPSGIEEFKKELAPYKSSKGSVQFPMDQPIPYELVKRIVTFRVEENLKK